MREPYAFLTLTPILDDPILIFFPLDFRYVDASVQLGLVPTGAANHASLGGAASRRRLHFFPML